MQLKLTKNKFKMAFEKILPTRADRTALEEVKKISIKPLMKILRK